MFIYLFISIRYHHLAQLLFTGVSLSLSPSGQLRQSLSKSQPPSSHIWQNPQIMWFWWQYPYRCDNFFKQTVSYNLYLASETLYLQIRTSKKQPDPDQHPCSQLNPQPPALKADIVSRYAGQTLIPRRTIVKKKNKVPQFNKRMCFLYGLVRILLIESLQGLWQTNCICILQGDDD